MQYLEPQQTQHVFAKSCDRCGHRSEENDIEFNEFLSIDRKAGYGSVFADGHQLQLDLCQHCVAVVLGEWMRVGDVSRS